jgi:hypothetical protein
MLAFAPTLAFGFVYDDRWTLVGNAWLERPLVELVGLLASGGALTQHVPDATRPLMVLGHAIERRIFGLNPWGYHLDSLLLYGLACGLATHLAWVVSHRRRVALFAGAFFAIAPLHAEVVAAINYREDLYAAVGTLGTLGMLGTRAASKVGGTRNEGARALAMAALFCLALLGKESALSLVPLLVVLCWCVPRIAVAVRSNRRGAYALGGVLLLWLLWRVPLALRGDDIPLAPQRSFVQTLLRTARFEVLAVGHSIFPWSYRPDYWYQPDASSAWAMPFLSLVVGAAVLGRNASTRLLGLGVGVALAAPLGCCPLLRPINEYADRYFFLSALGGGLVWAWVAERVGERLGLGRRTAWLALATVPLAVPAWHATQLWRSERSLWTAAVELTPGSPRAWAGLSRVHRMDRERDAADQAMARALAVDPDYVPGLVTQIYNDLAFERLAEARERLEQMTRRGQRDGGGLGKARRCAELDAAAAARCIGP